MSKFLDVTYSEKGAVLGLILQLCAKFYEATSNGCLWGSTWNNYYITIFVK